MNAKHDIQRAKDLAGSLVQPVELLAASSVKLEPVHWLWRNYLPLGMLTLLGGPAGSGKTTVATNFAATITRGSHWPDGTRCTSLGDVLIWSGEDVPAVLKARLMASGADLTRVHFVGGSGGDFDPGRDMAALESTMEALPEARLLILDPIVSAVAGDGHKGNEVRRALQPVVDLANRRNCSVIGITHLTKGTSGRDPVERITGSLAFAALARVVLIASKSKPESSNDEGEPIERRIFVRAKSNFGPDDGGFSYSLTRKEVAPSIEGQFVTWGEAIQGTAREVLAEAEDLSEGDDDKGTNFGGVDAFLMEVLKAGITPVSAVQDDAKSAGFAWRTVQRAAERRGVQRRKGGMKEGWYWSLPQDGSAQRCHEGAEHATPLALEPSASSAPSAHSPDDVEVF